MLGNQLIPEGFEAVYDSWLSMNHRRGKQGPLGDLMVPLCDKFNLRPPVTPKAPEQVLWRTVARGTSVLVTLNGVTKKGMFQGLGAYGEVEVSIEGQSWIQAVKPFQLQLDKSHLLPPELKLTPAEEAAMRPFEAGPSTDLIDPTDEFPPMTDEVDEDDEAPPVMSDPQWLEVAEGHTVIVQRGDEEPFEATFVRLGPGDGQLVASVDGEDELLDESFTTIGPVKVAPKPKVTKARTAKKKPAKKKPAAT